MHWLGAQPLEPSPALIKMYFIGRIHVLLHLTEYFLRTLSYVVHYKKQIVFLFGTCSLMEK